MGVNGSESGTGALTLLFIAVIKHFCVFDIQVNLVRRKGQKKSDIVDSSDQ